MAVAMSPSERRHNPIVDWAESGVVALTGHRDGPCLVPPGDAASWARRMAAWIAAVAQSAGRQISIDGAHVLTERAAMNDARRNGRISVGGASRLLRTADGWAVVSCARPDDPALLGALIGAALDVDDPWPAVTAWLHDHPGGELAERAELLGVAAGPVVRRKPMSRLEPRAPRSVDGLLVVDFSALWAGPLCAHLLGLAGARVVKVETPGRLDGARRGNAGFYSLLHSGHESVVLDPSEPNQRAALIALVASADIVIEASRPRALASFGLDAEAAVARGTTWVSITAAGRSCDRIGFGDDIAAAAGLVAHDDTGEPVFVGDAIADPLTGLTAAALAMSTSSSGDEGGALWDISMTDVVAATLARDPVPATRFEAGRWFVGSEGDAMPVSEPRVRRPLGRAAEPGVDTADVLRSLRIPLP